MAVLHPKPMYAIHKDSGVVHADMEGMTACGMSVDVFMYRTTTPDSVPHGKACKNCVRKLQGPTPKKYLSQIIMDCDAREAIRAVIGESIIQKILSEYNAMQRWLRTEHPLLYLKEGSHETDTK